MTIDQVIAGHDGARLADLDGDLERQQVGFTQRRFAQIRADHHAPRFLAVGDEMLDGRDDALRLNAGDRMAGQLAGEQRVFADVFEIAAAARFADQVRATCKLHVEALGLRLASDQCATVVCELAVERRAQQQRAGQTRGMVARAHAADIADPETGVGLLHGGDAQPRDARIERGRADGALRFELVRQRNGHRAGQPGELFVLGHARNQVLGALTARGGSGHWKGPFMMESS